MGRPKGKSVATLFLTKNGISSTFIPIGNVYDIASYVAMDPNFLLKIAAGYMVRISSRFPLQAHRWRLRKYLNATTVVLLLPEGLLAGNKQLHIVTRRSKNDFIVSVTIVYHVDIKASNLIRINLSDDFLK